MTRKQWYRHWHNYRAAGRNEYAWAWPVRALPHQVMTAREDFKTRQANSWYANYYLSIRLMKYKGKKHGPRPVNIRAGLPGLLGRYDIHYK